MSWGVIIFTTMLAGLCALFYLAGGMSKAPGLLIAMGLMAIFDLAVYWAGRSRRKRLASFGEAFDGRVATVRGGMLSKRRVEGRFRSREARLVLQPGGRAQPDYPIAQVACSAPLRFEFFRSAPIQIGTSKYAFQLGDAEIDRDFTFISKDSARTSEWLLKPENREKVFVMLRQGPAGSCLNLKHGFLSWERRGFSRAQGDKKWKLAMQPQSSDPSTPRRAESDRDALSEALESLNQLAASLEA